jgi:hypothetical protein
MAITKSYCRPVSVAHGPVRLPTRRSRTLRCKCYARRTYQPFRSGTYPGLEGVRVPKRTGSSRQGRGGGFQAAATSGWPADMRATAELRKAPG